ncbi:hypothetical protein OUZ56_020715 [Daphnia magna]|uniref:Chromo domain-containing protein n=1 Tax=Daphnia magna TaxID=35525 RepID=A0ABQ9ZF88_9CRUS|nr:hypothetical protein OUZ56_020715 [Daphnia magna]
MANFQHPTEEVQKGRMLVVLLDNRRTKVQYLLKYVEYADPEWTDWANCSNCKSLVKEYLRYKRAAAVNEAERKSSQSEVEPDGDASLYCDALLPSAEEQGPSAEEQGPSAEEQGPSAEEQGPSAKEPGPPDMDSTPLATGEVGQRALRFFLQGFRLLRPLLEQSVATEQQSTYHQIAVKQRAKRKTDRNKMQTRRCHKARKYFIKFNFLLGSMTPRKF